MQHTRPSSHGWSSNAAAERASEATAACLDDLPRAPSAAASAQAGKLLGTGAGLAMSVAALFVAACQQRSAQDTPSAGEGTTAGQPAKSMPAPPDSKSGNVQCVGIHECKGKSACHVIGSHACAGLNTCKGKGWIAVPAAECQTKGGKVLDS